MTDHCPSCGGTESPDPIVTRCTYCENEDPESSTFENLDEEEGT